MVPELSQLRDKDRTEPPKFYMERLVPVCTHLFKFVETQRNNLVRKVIQNHDYPYEVRSTIDRLTITKNGDLEHRRSCRWDDWDATRLHMD